MGMWGKMAFSVPRKAPISAPRVMHQAAIRPSTPGSRIEARAKMPQPASAARGISSRRCRKEREDHQRRMPFFSSSGSAGWASAASTVSSSTWGCGVLGGGFLPPLPSPSRSSSSSTTGGGSSSCSSGSAPGGLKIPPTSMLAEVNTAMAPAATRRFFGFFSLLIFSPSLRTGVPQTVAASASAALIFASSSSSSTR